MTKKDYDLIAETLGKELSRIDRWSDEAYKKDKEYWESLRSQLYAVENIVWHLSRDFKRTNPKFDEIKFSKAVEKAKEADIEFWNDIHSELDEKSS